MPLLKPGDHFPPITITPVDGEAIDLPDALAGRYADPVHLQSTGFVLDPDGNVVVSVYSSGAIGRLVPNDVAGLVTYVKSRIPA